MVIRFLLILWLASLPLGSHAQAAEPYNYVRTVSIIQGSPEGFHVFAMPAGETLADNPSLTAFAKLYQLLSRHQQPDRQALDPDHMAPEVRYTLIMVSPEGQLEIQVGEPWLHTEAGYSLMQTDEFLQLQGILDTRNRVSQKQPPMSLAQTIVDIQAQYLNTELPLPFAAEASEPIAGNNEVEVQKSLVIKDARPESAREASTAAPAKAVTAVPKKVDTLVVHDEPPKADAPQVKVTVAKEAQIIDQRADKPKKESKGLSSQDLQMLYFIGGLIALAVVIAGLNRLVNKGKK